MAKLRTSSDGVFVSALPFGSIDREGLDQVEKAALLAPRRRARICCHQGLEDSPQEMLISLQPGTYIRPHKHYKKAESGLAVRGLANAVFFDDAGRITDVWLMGAETTGYRFFYRIAEPVFHCLLVRDAGFLFHEVATGPLRQDDTAFATWSPPEDDQESVMQYMHDLRRRVDHFRAPE